MLIQHNLADVTLEFRIDYAQRAAAVAHENLFRAGIETNVVRVAAQIVFMDLLERSAIVNANVAVDAVGDIQPVHVRPIENSLWFLQTADRVDYLPGREVDYFNGIVSKRRNKQSLTCNVRGQMIDAPGDVRQWNGGFQTQWLRKEN